MALTREQIDRLRKKLNDCSGCIHGRNILGKKDKKYIERFFDNYLKFLKSMTGVLAKKIEAFIDYKQFVKDANRFNGSLIFSPQSKFESTILEEFLFHLFKEFIRGDTILAGSVKAYNNLYFSPASLQEFETQNFIKVNQKDQDFAIYKKVQLQDGHQTIDLFVPVVAIECKTYLDKTMLEGSIATAEKIKAGNPHCKFYIVTETYEVDKKVDPSTSRIDNIFVLKKGGSNQRDGRFYPDVVGRLYETVQTHLNTRWSDISENIRTQGTIF